MRKCVKVYGHLRNVDFMAKYKNVNKSSEIKMKSIFITQNKIKILIWINGK